MKNSLEKSIDNKSEQQEKNPKDVVIGWLAEMGFDDEIIKDIGLKPVDHYHANCFAVHSPRQPEPLFIVKFLDPTRGWDVNEDDNRREHDFGFLASEIVPELKPRKLSGWFAGPGIQYPIVFYEYLGQAATYVESPEETLAIVERIIPLLVKLHTNTTSEYFGQSLNQDNRKIEHSRGDIGPRIAQYLINDIKRENLDPSGEIIDLINNLWIPRLNTNKLFALTHKDITLSNILLRDGQITSIIDWTYSGWSDPANDIAYILFWALIRNKIQEAQNIFGVILPKYQSVGLELEKNLPFFLAFKCIEYGRFKKGDWINVGKDLLNCKSTDEMFDLFRQRLNRP